ncbi:MAG: hypothetical protein LBH79_03055 [Nitrososphaerota archaeon]|jgi:hypothetical protein|nr:hypothetical protein [Nitrososphaerota archaeon]
MSEQGPLHLSISISVNDFQLAQKACQVDGGFPTVEVWIQHLIHETLEIRLAELAALPQHCMYTPSKKQKAESSNP